MSVDRWPRHILADYQIVPFIVDGGLVARITCSGCSARWLYDGTRDPAPSVIVFLMSHAAQHRKAKPA